MQITNTASLARIAASSAIAPLDLCAIAPENVRPNDLQDDKIVELADSIASPIGLLNDPIAYEQDGKFFITAGGRRLRALKLLQAEGRLPEHFKNGISLELRDKKSAVEVSITENSARAEMTLTDELRGYRSLAQKGFSSLEIAKMTSSSEKHVRKMLRLCDVAPEVLAAFDEGTIELDAVRAFATIQDHEYQRDILTSGIRTAYAIRHAILTALIRSTDPRVKLIGLDAYRNAGGRLSEDLFAEEVFLHDEALLNRLVEEKQAELIAEYHAQGWGDVLASWKYAIDNRPRLTPNHAEPSAEQADRIAELEAISESDCSWAERSQASREIDAIRDTLAYFTDEQKSTGTVHIALGNECRPSYYAPKVVSASAEAIKQAKAAAAPFGHSGHERMTRIASLAIRNEVALAPEKGLSIMVAQQAYSVMRAKRYHSEMALPRAKMADVECESTNLTTDAAFCERFDKWDEVLPETFDAVFDFVCGLDEAQKLELLALTTALQIDGVERRVDQPRREAWAQIGTFARFCGLDFRDVWTPTADFLSSAGKPRLLEILKACEIEDDHGALKKGALVEVVEKAVKMNRWIPDLLANLTRKSNAA